MSATTTPDGPSPRLVALLLLALFLAWAILPALTMPNISNDAAEGLIWGRNFQLGYEKHPPLQAWLLRGTHVLFGTGSLTHVWLSAACITIAHWAVWRAALRVVNPWTAFWASAALQLIPFHTYMIPEFNPNVLLVPFAALAGLFAMHAMERGRLKDWLLLGVVVGAGMYAKYAMALIAAAIALFFLVDRDGRKRLASAGPWIALAAALIVLAPHLWWMIDSRGQTLSYVIDRAQTSNEAVARAKNLGEFILQLLAFSLPMLLAMRLGRARDQRLAVDPGDAKRRLVFWLAVAPFALTALMALVAGFRIKTAWLSPLWCYAPLALMLMMQVDASTKRFARGAAVIIAMGVIGLGGYLATNLFRPYLQHKAMRIHFPGEALAHEAERLWTSQTTKPLRIVIGGTLPAGSLAHYSRLDPMVRVNDDEAASPWASETLIKQDGALIIWEAEDGDALPPEIAARRPGVKVLEVLSLPQQTGANVPPARIGVGYLAPSP